MHPNDSLFFWQFSMESIIIFFERKCVRPEFTRKMVSDSLPSLNDFSSKFLFVGLRTLSPHTTLFIDAQYKATDFLTV